MSQSWSAEWSAALTVSILWVAGSLLAFMAWSLSEDVRFGYIIVEAILGVWLPIALWALVPILALGQFIRLLILGDFKHAPKWSVPPIVAALILVGGANAGDDLRFEFYNATYRRVVADATAGRCSTEDRKRWHVDIDSMDCTSPVTVIFVWGGFGSFWYGIVYDAADQIMKAASDRSMVWRNRETGSLLSCSRASKAMGNHFYLASGNYTSDSCG